MFPIITYNVIFLKTSLCTFILKLLWETMIQLHTNIAYRNFWTLDAERKTVGVKSLKFKTFQSFGNNGAILIKSIYVLLISGHSF